MNLKNNFSLYFIGIGAEKSGTTWIADCLSGHPEICIPKEKELYFFNEYDPHYLKVKNFKYNKGLKWYKTKFKSCKIGNKRGEITPTYLYCEKAARRIKHAFPNIKIIAVLRDPAARAFSQYIHDKRIGLIKNIDFAEALKNFDNYTEKGYYYKHLNLYYKLFPEKNILTVIYDDIKNSPEKTLKKIYKFLNLKDKNYIPPQLYKKSNAAAEPKLPLLNYFMIHAEYYLKDKKLSFLIDLMEKTGIRKLFLRLRDFNSRPLKNYPEMNLDIKKHLKKIYINDLEKLEKLLKINLDNWK